MAYNLREDWEQTKKNMERLAYENRYSASCQQWNNEMTNLVNKYKQEEMAWYNSPQITENGFRTTTQNLWYTHYLNKKRLMTLGLTARYAYIEPTEYVRGENQRYPHWNYSHDGKNLICRISDGMSYKKAFYDRERLVWSDEKRKAAGEYYMIQSRSMNGNYICPNCGWEDTLDYFVDGCDYCQRKFHIEDLKQKVSSVYNPGDWKQHRSGFTIHKNFMPMYVILVIVVFGLMQLAANMGTAMMMITPALGFVAVVIFLAILMGKTSKESIEGGPAKNAADADEDSGDGQVFFC